MSMLQNRLHISTIDSRASALAEEYGLGIEIAEYCTAWNMDEHFPETHQKVSRTVRNARSVIFHAPFSDLCPAAIDPRVRQITRERYGQAIGLAGRYGAKKIIIHSGYIPTVYFPEWFSEQSVCFWRELLPEVPEDMTICLENVMESAPDMLTQIVSAVEDPRLRLCLDIGHAHTELSRTAPERWIERMRPYLSHVHLHDNEGGWDTHLPLGQGTISLKPVLQMLLPMENITFTVENMDARPSIEWLVEHSFL